MFGYFRPYQSNLTQTESQLFNSHYCRLCYCLRILGGQIARFLVTFDAAVFSIILNFGKGEDDPPFLQCKPFGKKHLKLFYDDEEGLKLARLTLISFGGKFEDDLLDGKSLKAKILRALFKKSVFKAREAEPDIAVISSKGTDKINRMQDENKPLGEIFAVYGDMAAEAFKKFKSLSPEQEELIRALAEWTFFVDVVCDYDEDFKNDEYNGLKDERYPTFKEFFDHNYVEFTALEKKMTDRLVNALNAYKDDSRRWNTVYRIVMHAVDTVIPSIVEGKDVKFHYAKETLRNIRVRVEAKKDRKGLREYRK